MSQTQEDALVAWLKALSHPVRLRTLLLLAEHGELRVTDLINHIDGLEKHNQSSLSQHLSVLRRERIVGTRRDKQFIYYSINEDKQAKMAELLQQVKAA